MRVSCTVKTWSMALLLTLFSSVTLAAAQVLQLGRAQPYDLLAYSNADQLRPELAERAVVIVHGVRRNAQDYYAGARQLLANAGLGGPAVLLIAPNFLSADDSPATDAMPLWPKDRWMQGSESSAGRRGIATFSVLDDLLAYLADSRRFPRLKEVVLIGHSAGAQLMQRYAVLGKAVAGLPVRYVISSPSSYLYLDANRPTPTGFAPLPGKHCPGYNQYRYGLERPPAYLVSQGLDAKQLFRRYAARNVTYLVGERDTHAASRIMDHSCGAEAQGRDRVQRQLGYLRYERFVSRAWAVDIAHRQFVVPGVGHNAAHLLASPQVARWLFPGER